MRTFLKVCAALAAAVGLVWLLGRKLPDMPPYGPED